MDFYCIEALLDLPAFQVINQVIRPQQLDRHLERRERTIVCPRCATCCSRVKESRTRGIRDLPMLERPIMLWLHLRRFACRACPHRPWETRETFGERVKWTERLYHQVREDCLRGCPSRVLARRYVVSLHAPSCAGPLRGVGEVARASLGESAAMQAVFGDRVHVLGRFHEAD